MRKVDEEVRIQLACGRRRMTEEERNQDAINKIALRIRRRK